MENPTPPACPSWTQHGLGVCIWMPLVNGTGNSPSLGQPTPRVVKQDKSSRGSVDTTKTRSNPQRVTMSSGERPIGAAKGKQSDTEALCQPPPPPPVCRQVIVQRPKQSKPCALHFWFCVSNSVVQAVGRFCNLWPFLMPPAACRVLPSL